jgi:hypothetical protein
MNESEWLASSDPQAMLDHLDGKASDRKLRLFACACVRRFWLLLRDTRCRLAVETAERFADGTGTATELTTTREDAQMAAQEAPTFDQLAYVAAAATVEETALEAARATARAARAQAGPDAAYGGVPGIDEQRAYNEGVQVEARTQADLLRHIFGNPFRQVTVDPICLTWSNGAIASMALLIYENNQFEDLPFLADALLDAGCTDEELLTHCRAPGEHRRGCWAIDTLLRRT